MTGCGVAREWNCALTASSNIITSPETPLSDCGVFLHAHTHTRDVSVWGLLEWSRPWGTLGRHGDTGDTGKGIKDGSQFTQKIYSFAS